MDTVLDTAKTMKATIIEHLFELEDDEFEDDYKLTLWVKEKDIIRPSGEMKTSAELDPGVYTVDFNRELGYYCQKLHSVSDELFVFSNSITEKLFEEIDMFWMKSDLYKQHQLTHKRGILLEGYPGTGKSSIITLLSNKIISKGGIVFKISGLRNLSHYVEFLRNSFRKIQPNTPVITILEDINQYADAELELLDFLDGKTHIKHHILIATTNNVEEIPDTFLRPSRLDVRVEVSLPDSKIRKEYFEHKKVPTDMINDLVEQTEDCTLADLKEIYICIFLLDYSIESAVSKITDPTDKKNYLFSTAKVTKMGI